MSYVWATWAGKLQITNATVSGSIGTSAIEVEGRAELLQTILQDNDAGSGAAVAVLPGGRLDATTAVFRLNKASWLGGALYCQDGTLQLRDTEMSFNRAGDAGPTNFIGFGGALFAGSGCIVDFQARTDMSSNSATQEGGVMMVRGGSITFSGWLQAFNNSAQKRSGFAHILEGGAVTVQNATIQRHHADEAGLSYIKGGGQLVCIDCTIFQQNASIVAPEYNSPKGSGYINACMNASHMHACVCVDTWMQRSCQD